MFANSASRIREQLTGAELHGALLFYGPPGTGKESTAWWWASHLLDRPPADGEFWHPDLHLAIPDGNTLKVSAIRKLNQALSLVANERGWRVGLVLGGERMNQNAANALLKTLEEPPERTSIVVVTSAVQALPRTVRSRTLAYRFSPEPESELERALCENGIPEDDAWLAAALGGSTTEAALAWAEDQLETARELVGVIESADTTSSSELLDFAEGFRGGARVRPRAELFLDVHSAWLRHTTERAISRTENCERWLRCAESGLRARRDYLARNLNAQLVVEGLLFELQDALRTSPNT